MSVLVRLSLSLAIIAAAVAIGGCSILEARLGGVGPMAEEETMAGRPGGDRYPDVLAVELRPQGERFFDVAVTLSSPYDTPERYADGWRVLDPDGDVLGSHTLAHDHASEQPFTRVQRGLHIPAGVMEVTVEGRDQANGFGGLTVTVSVP